MKRLVIVLLIAAACKSGAPSAAPSAAAGGPGAATPRAAVDGFMGAVKTQDLQAMALLWGSSKGPARDVVARDQLEKRELIMQCYLAHDSYQVLSEEPGRGGERVFNVQLKRGDLTRETTIKAVPGPGGRWFVNEANLEPLRDLCSGNPAGERERGHDGRR